MHAHARTHMHAHARTHARAHAHNLANIMHTRELQTGVIDVVMTYAGHSHDCDCDTSSWQCSKQDTVAGRTPMEAVARFTLTPKYSLLASIHRPIYPSMMMTMRNHPDPYRMYHAPTSTTPASTTPPHPPPPSSPRRGGMPPRRSRLSGRGLVRKQWRP